MGAYWAAWADALPTLQARRPVEAASLLLALDSPRPLPPSLAALREAANVLAAEGFAGPAWGDILQGTTPPAPSDDPDAEEEARPEPGDFRHGWQFHACSQRNRYFREQVLWPRLSPTTQAMIRSGSGPRAAEWLGVLPTAPGLRMTPQRFLLSLRRRLRLPLLLADRWCGLSGPGCGLELDARGDHRAAFRTGLRARRAGPVERAWFRVAREAVVFKQLLARHECGGAPPG